MEASRNNLFLLCNWGRNQGFTVFMLLCCASVAFADQKMISIEERVARHMAQLYNSGQFYGSMLVAKDGVIIYETGMGEANSTWGIKNSPEVKYPIASITKVFTAILTLQLVESGHLQLDQSANRYLPDALSTLDRKITVEHLLTHQSGVEDHVNSLSDQDYINRYGLQAVDPIQIVKDMMQMPVHFEPGHSSSYSNTGYVLLGVILEQVTGKSFCQLLNERILTPAGMTDSGCLFYATVVPSLATAYQVNNGKLTHVDFDQSNFSDGMAYSTVRDMLKLDLALRHGKLLSNSMQRKMSSPKVKEPWVEQHYGALTDLAYGYGVANWILQTNQRNYRVSGHGGAGWGVTTLFWRIPEQGIVVVVFNNRSIRPFPNHLPLIKLATELRISD